MFKRLKVYYILVSLPFLMLILGAMIFFSAIVGTITRNPHPQINYTIFVIILVGGIIIISTTRRLVRQAGILREFAGAIHDKKDSVTLQQMAEGYTGDLASIIQMIAASGGRSISHQEQAALEHELANVNSRLYRRNALPQYMTGLLVGMGLLGTFIGLLSTLNDISVLISSFADLDMANVSPLEVFRTMIERMKAPMTSMGVAFSASMFGLLGSIILGLMMIGLRRLQNDISSLLASEVARHIETALAFESIDIKPRESTGDLSTDVLLRIEERLTEAARIRQRALSTEIDDFKRQRAEMLRALTEQTEANNNFRAELQQLGAQLGAVFNSMEKAGSAISAQISDLTVRLAGDARETQKLLVSQVEEQKALKSALDSYNIEERFTETIRIQQRALSAEVDDFKNQRADMLRALTEQTEANHKFRAEFKDFGTQIADIFKSLEKGNGEISDRVSDLTVRVAGDAKEAHKLLAGQIDEQRGLRTALNSYNIGERLAEAARLQQQTLVAELDDFKKQREDMTRTLAEQTKASSNFCAELQKLGGQLNTMLGSMEKGSEEISTQISELTVHVSADAKQSHLLLNNMNNNFRSEMLQLGRQIESQLGELSNILEKGSGERSAQISELMVRLSAEAKETQKLLAVRAEDRSSE